MLRIKDFKAEVKDVQRKWLETQAACQYIGCSSCFLDSLRKKNLVVWAASNRSSGRSIVWYNVESIDKYIESCMQNTRKIQDMALRCSL